MESNNEEEESQIISDFQKTELLKQECFKIKQEYFFKLTDKDFENKIQETINDYYKNRIDPKEI